MKRVMIFFGMIALSFVLVACGGNDGSSNQSENTADEGTANETEQSTGNDDATENEESSDEQAENTDSDNMKAKMDELDYSDFELEVDYGKDKEYEAEIEQKDGKVEADLEDEVNGDDVNGQEAFDKIYPLVEQLTIDKDTEKDDAIAEVLDIFSLDDDYEKFELEITLSDGVKVEFEEKR